MAILIQSVKFGGCFGFSKIRGRIGTAEGLKHARNIEPLAAFLEKSANCVPYIVVHAVDIGIHQLAPVSVCALIIQNTGYDVGRHIDRPVPRRSDKTRGRGAYPFDRLGAKRHFFYEYPRR
jgi:hypothetical protein